MKKALLLFSSFLLIIGCLSGCGKKEDIPTVNISIWTNATNEELIKSQLEEFKKLHEAEANFEFTVSIEGEDTCKASVLANPEGAADIFSFADDQLNEMYQAGALLEITQNTDEIIKNVGGPISGAATAITRDDKLYAYPVTAGNGYFLYYNSEYFTEDDVKSLDKILEIANKNDKKFTMDLSSGWYICSFFKGAGLTVEAHDGNTNICNWNATDTKYTGVAVTESILAMAKNPGYVNYNDDGFVAGVENGEIIAGINGPWNAEKVSKAWGENYAATKLPTYTLDGEQVQMYSFMGYKLMGISAYTKEPEWCMTLAEYLTNEENQLKRFENAGESPANVNAALNENVQSSPAISALAKQSVYGSIQSIADPFWEASARFGIIIAAGNSDNKDLQQLLDSVVAEITATE